MAKSKKDEVFYRITISEWVLFDPKFSKKYQNFFPLSHSFLNSKVIESLTATRFRLIIGLIQLAHSFGKASFKVSERLLRANGEVTERLLSDLQQNQILSFYKEKKETTEIEENKSQWFQDFVVKEMGSLDTGLIILSSKIEKCFGGEPGFREWVGGVTTTKKFKEITAEEQIRYFKKALNDEMKMRGFA